MDPQSALQELRWAIEDLKREFTNDDYADSSIEDTFDRLQQHFEGLDDWLRKGGALPTDWSRD